ncbi:hypothetical protein [Flavobacterium hungaricum]|uniref:Uncharacterized protein n=1 Tax=Flavobacterium hungaricum TaxID=2082725 RepID=A0ABR9TFW0_9FLAO|nr:hypothetical protein [Flavobacterium hungaricum]MBE8724245.1 hypothetical protein [Flavobacterium hungaricum]
MNKLGLFLRKNQTQLLYSEVFVFLFFIFLTIIFDLYKNSHKYFNNSDFPLNFDGLFAYTVTILFGLFFFIVIIFPFIFLFQFLFILKFKMLDKEKKALLFALILLYFGVVVSVFSLYSVKQHQNLNDKKAIALIGEYYILSDGSSHFFQSMEKYDHF